MEVSQDDKNMAMLVHGLVGLSGLASFLSALRWIGFLAAIASVVLYFVFKSRSEFVVRHAKQAAGLQVLIFVLSLVMAIIFGGVAVTAAVTGGLGAALAMSGLALLFGLAIGIIALLFGIMGLLKAQKGEGYLYPVVGRFVDNLKI